MTLDEFEKRLRDRGVRVTLAGFVRAAAVAHKLFGVTPRTLGNWRDNGEGPEPKLIGGNWYYSVDAL